MSFTPQLAGTPTYLPPEEAGTIARIRFAATMPHAAALDSITELSSRLGDPCYEQQPQGRRSRGTRWARSAPTPQPTR